MRVDFQERACIEYCYSTRVNFLLDDFLRRAEKITVLQQIKCEAQSNHLVFPVHHKHQKDDHSSFQQRADDGAFDVEEIIEMAYKQAQKIAVILKMSALLKRNHAFELNDLRSSIEKHLTRASKVKVSLQLNLDQDVMAVMTMTIMIGVALKVIMRSVRLQPKKQRFME